LHECKFNVGYHRYSSLDPYLFPSPLYTTIFIHHPPISKKVNLESSNKNALAMHANSTNHISSSPQPVTRLNGSVGVRLVASTMSWLVELWVVDTLLLAVVGGVGMGVVEGLVRGSWGELLAVALATAVVGFAAADGEHPEHASADGEGNGKPSKAEEWGL